MNEPKSALEALIQQFEQGDYTAIITALRIEKHLETKLLALLGISYLRTGQFEKAEMPLRAATQQGDLEASVEFGNLLRATNKNQRAAQHFKALLPSLEGELKYRALRWYGVALYAIGDAESLESIEAARAGYHALGDYRMVARISHTLAATHSAYGDYNQAKRLLDEALPTLKVETNRRPLLSAYATLTDIHLDLGRLDDARHTLDLAQTIARELDDEYSQVQIEARRISMMRKAGDYAGFITRLNDLRQRADKLGESDVYTFASLNLAAHFGRSGRHSEAIRVMAELRQKKRDMPLEGNFMLAMMSLWRGGSELKQALRMFMEVRQQALNLQADFEAAKALLLAAYCHYLMHDFEEAVESMSGALLELAGQPAKVVKEGLDEELKDIAEMLAFARMTPGLVHIIEATLEETAALASHAQDDAFSSEMFLELMVLGPQPQVLLNTVPCTLSSPHSLSILAYLALQPRASRLQITTDLWGDHDPAKAAYSFRQCLMEIRRQVSPELIVKSGSHQEPLYSLSPKAAVVLDSQRVLQLVARGELPLAVAIYRGLFLERAPVVTEWLEEQRDRVKNSIAAALQSQLQGALLSGDDRRVVLIASAILAIDPENLEIEELRLDKAQHVSPPQEFARFMAERKRRLN